MLYYHILGTVFFNHEFDYVTTVKASNLITTLKQLEKQDYWQTLKSVVATEAA